MGSDAVTSHLARDRVLRQSRGGKSGKTRQEAKGKVKPNKELADLRLKENNDEGLEVVDGRLRCTHCASYVDSKKTSTKQHLQSAMHKANKVKAGCKQVQIKMYAQNTAAVVVEGSYYGE
jgi:hypothetical protein